MGRQPSNRVCDFPDCGRKHSCKGYCATHYIQYKKGKELTPIGESKYSRDSKGIYGDHHGTPGGYSNHNCRCDLCRIAWNAYCAGKKSARTVSSGEEKEGIKEHGKYTSYHAGCRCKACTTANSVYVRDKKYLLESDEYQRLLNKSDGRCMNCGKESKLVLDHCHDTNKIRGLLCHSCNTGIGKLGDSVEGLERAIEYLLRTS